jgi:hypothetical protein
VTICIDIGEVLIKRLFHACAEADMANHGTSFVAIRRLIRLLNSRIQPNYHGHR